MAEENPLSVSAAMAQAKAALEHCVLTLVGEVSEVSNKPGYKAVYFTVKDTGASLPCMIWKNRYDASGVSLKPGDLVILTGRFSLYAPKGRMNFDVFSISLSGEGQLRLQVANLARKLKSEGLMEASQKLPLPKYPQRIGLVTSPRGAAVHDVLRTLRRRYPMAEIVFAGVPVEGPQAARDIVDGMVAVVNAHAELLLLVRGGGSFEDLMPFNDERLARTIHACPIPVVTGIGHEPDTSIADMVADVRASTPTGAAEAASPDTNIVLQQLDAKAAGISSALSLSIERKNTRVQQYLEKPLFKDAHLLFANDEQKLDIIAEHFAQFAAHVTEKPLFNVQALDLRLNQAIPHALERDSVALNHACKQLQSISQALLVPYRHELDIKASRLKDISPFAILARGYSLTRNDEGEVIKSVEQLAEGNTIHVDMNDGVVHAQVLGCEQIKREVFSWKEEQ